MKNNKRIEELATTALTSALLKCPILETYIGSNDKTPSWDGTVFVYNSSNQKKENIKGRVPIQVKGTEKVLVSDVATFSCSTVDLRNYYHDGGCVFFLISVVPATGEHKIFYASLLVVDLDKILKRAQKQKTYSIGLKLFPENDPKEIAHIFLSFSSNARKQVSFIEKDLLSIEELERRGTKIERLTFNTSGIGLKEEDLPRFVSSHDFYLYAKPEGLDIEIPIDRITDAIVSKTVDGEIKVKERTYFNSYVVQYFKGEPTIRIGKGLNLVLNQTNKKLSISFKPSGTLSDFIKEASLLLDVLENREISINGAKISFSNPITIDVEARKKSLAYYKNVKKMLESLGVTEELQIDAISPRDESNLKNFVGAVLYNRKIDFRNMTENFIYGPFKIANLVIWIWAERNQERRYSVESFFSPHQIVMFASNDINRKNPIPMSQFLLLDKKAFIHTSNMNYELVYQDIARNELKPEVVDHYTFWLLDILRAYDEQEQKDPRLLCFAEKICDWIRAQKCSDEKIMLLNKMQIIKRRRKLNPAEIVELSKLTVSDYPISVRCGAYLLLDDKVAAQECFDEMDIENQKIFLTYPICSFGSLQNDRRHISQPKCTES
ncbi:hypothetical protein [uncultured Subdoligranulum sp.]|uniref:hypothetical protein n=1 Tax=uncultured Subdoligranulum sp. TaxID=512298 RepID=UPI0026112ED4|nr:hypothetical protein [uncultured Subdoligranulum sp.]